MAHLPWPCGSDKEDNIRNISLYLILMCCHAVYMQSNTGKFLGQINVGRKNILTPWCRIFFGS
jgi:hypothetical protein